MKAYCGGAIQGVVVAELSADHCTAALFRFPE